LRPSVKKGKNKMSIKSWFADKKFRVKQWLKAHVWHFAAIISTTILIAAGIFMLEQWLESEMLKIQFPEIEYHVIPRAHAETAQASKIDVSEVVSKVYSLESSDGLNDKCVRKGKGYNGYGYGQSLTVDNCYKTPGEVKNLVTAWFNRNLDTMTLPQALCYYNLGKPDKTLVSDCTYYQNYLKL